jgi:hypothetical protein
MGVRMFYRWNPALFSGGTGGASTALLPHRRSRTPQFRIGRALNAALNATLYLEPSGSFSRAVWTKRHPR